MEDQMITEGPVYVNNTGWICPKCGKAVSPEYKVCPYCSTTQTDENMAPGEQMICG